MADAEYVLVVPGKSSRRVFHLPDEDNPGLPDCHPERQSRRYFKKDPEKVPDDHTLCKSCDPDYDRDYRNTGEQLCTRLERMSADDVGRHTAGGDA